jgi:hypothetical protein
VCAGLAALYYHVKGEEDTASTIVALAGVGLLMIGVLVISQS